MAYGDPSLAEHKFCYSVQKVSCIISLIFLLMLFAIYRASVMWTSEGACVSEERGGEEEGESVCVIFLVSSIICFLCIVSLY